MLLSAASGAFAAQIQHVLPQITGSVPVGVTVTLDNANSFNFLSVKAELTSGTGDIRAIFLKMPPSGLSTGAGNASGLGGTSNNGSEFGFGSYPEINVQPLGGYNFALVFGGDGNDAMTLAEQNLTSLNPPFSPSDVTGVAVLVTYVPGITGGYQNVVLGFNPPAAVPEPASMSLAAAGLFLAAVQWRRRTR